MGKGSGGRVRKNRRGKIEGLERIEKEERVEMGTSKEKKGRR